MRTIIINTLGSELQKNPLFYLPFRETQLHWIEHSLGNIGDCVEQVTNYNNAQDKQHKSHLVVLVSLARYAAAQYKELRTAHKEIIFAYLNQKLLLPLVQERRQGLAGVSVVFVLPQPRDGTNGIPAEDINLHVLGVDLNQETPVKLVMTDDDGNQTVDLTELFANALQDYRISCQNAEAFDSEHDMRGTQQRLKDVVAEKLRSMQTCRFLPAGKEAMETLPTEQLEFCPLTTDWDLFAVDLQMNLSEHLAERKTEREWQLKLVAHETEDLRARISCALDRVRYLKDHAPRLAFYDDALPTTGQPKQSITGDIWTALDKSGLLPDLQQIREETKEPEQEEEPQEQTALGKELRAAWIRIDREKESFYGYCKLLEQQYAPEAAEKEQKGILDVCAKVFGQWRREVLTRPEDMPETPKAVQMPEFDSTAHQAELDKAQKEWGAATVKQLEDYTDVRKQAEQIKADFRKAYRLWPEGEFNATSKFCIYSIVLAVLFILQMLLPYMCITLTQDGFAIGRLLHFAMSLILFVVLYGVGALLWMRSMCRQLNQCTRQMYQLLLDSRRCRNRSIARAVEIYGTVLPSCTLKYERLQYLQRIYEKNLRRKERYNTHKNLLRKAEELLYEMQTLLRMQDGGDPESIKITGGIDYEKPPSHGDNVPYYIFMSEKWGRC